MCFCSILQFGYVFFNNKKSTFNTSGQVSRQAVHAGKWHHSVLVSILSKQRGARVRPLAYAVESSLGKVAEEGRREVPPVQVDRLTASCDL